MPPNRFSKVRQSLLANEDDVSTYSTPYKPSTADATVGADGWCWTVHSKVLASHSNFFRRAFYGQFKEARDHHIGLTGVDRKILGFVITYTYVGWDQAIWRRLYYDLDGHNLPSRFLVEIVSMPDYLDMPVLQDAYMSLCRRLIRMRRDSKSSDFSGEQLAAFRNDAAELLTGAIALIKHGAPAGRRFKQKVAGFCRHTHLLISELPELHRAMTLSDEFYDEAFGLHFHA